MNTQITFNGKQYSSIGEMPADVREAYQQATGLLADQNKNGVPDIFEGAQGVTSQIITTQPTIIFEGKTYNNAADLPPKAREKYEKAMAKLGDANQNGVPDILEGLGALSAAPASKPAASSQFLSAIGIAIIVMLAVIAALLAVLILK